ncbi:hypothetical protein SAMN05720765_101366 [Fibrobacter sp. UWH6]|nr:hypothetical protein SAMN05720765_101366 [Fibrobacter sp. UWH6]
MNYNVITAEELQKNPIKMIEGFGLQDTFRPEV